MEQWQKEHIKLNPETLEKNVNGSAKLMKYLLKTGDLDESVFNARRIKEEDSNCLYETLQYSAKGYETLTIAACECRQTEILEILLDGFPKKELNQLLKQCRIPINISTVQSTEIWMKGCKLKVEDVFTETDLSTLEEIIRDNHLEEEYIVTFIIRREDKKIELPETIPPEPPIYIPRLVSNRLKLEPAIFEENLEDLFLFKCLKHYELQTTANRKRTTTFRKIIENQELDKNESLKERGCNPDMQNNKGETFNQLLNTSMGSNSFKKSRANLDYGYGYWLRERRNCKEESVSFT